jgi:hypothetical protein
MVRPYYYTDDFIGAKITDVLPIEKTTDAWPCIVIKTLSGRTIKMWINACQTLEDTDIYTSPSIGGKGERMRCKYCGKESEREYCPSCQEIRDAFQKAKEAEDRLIAFRKVMEM